MSTLEVRFTSLLSNKLATVPSLYYLMQIKARIDLDIIRGIYEELSLKSLFLQILDGEQYKFDYCRHFLNQQRNLSFI